MQAPLSLDRYDRLPTGLLDIKPREIRQIFPNPSLISVDGRSGAPLFLSVMLHGNETTGFFVLQSIARAFAEAPPQRPLLIFVGNVEATERGVRAVPGKADYNRVWDGSDTPEAALTAEVVEIARRAEPFASIDIHNNTGANPLYGCVNVLSPEHLQLASLFSRLCVYYTNPSTVQSMAFSKFCPATTIECGKPADPEGVKRATQFVLDVLHLDHLDTASHATRDLMLYHTVGRIIIDPDTAFSFTPSTALLTFANDLERLNFSPLSAGTLIAKAETAANPIKVVNERGDDLTGQFLTFDNGAIRLSRSAVPAMLTSSEDIIRQDCLGYLMEEIEAG